MCEWCLLNILYLIGVSSKNQTIAYRSKVVVFVVFLVLRNCLLVKRYKCLIIRQRRIWFYSQNLNTHASRTTHTIQHSET